MKRVEICPSENREQQWKPVRTMGRYSEILRVCDRERATSLMFNRSFVELVQLNDVEF